MTLMKKYRFYRRILQTLLAVNVGFVIMGALALAEYLKTHEPTSLELFVTGFGTLIFGIALPWFIIHQIVQQVREIRHQTEKRVAQWVSHGLESYRSHEGDPLKDPLFWVNMGLMTVEILTEESRHPAARAFSELAPMIRSEIKKNTPKQKVRKAKAG